MKPRNKRTIFEILSSKEKTKENNGKNNIDILKYKGVKYGSKNREQKQES